MANSSRMNGENEKRHARAAKPACADADSVDRNLPAQLYVDNTVPGVNVRIPDPAGGDGWIAAAVSLTTVTDACDGEILATGLSAGTDRQPLVRKGSAVRDRRAFRSAVERWVNKHATMR